MRQQMPVAAIDPMESEYEVWKCEGVGLSEAEAGEKLCLALSQQYLPRTSPMAQYLCRCCGLRTPPSLTFSPAGASRPVPGNV